MRSILSSALAIVYLVVGVIVAHSHKYFAHVNGIRSFVSAFLAVVLWPLVLAGVNLHIH
jgi:hypothetical protein